MRHLYLFPLFLMLYEFTVYMSNDMYIPAFPFIARDLSAHADMVQLTLSSWLFGGAIAQLALGPLSDRFGKRPILFYGGFLFVLSCLGCFWTSTILSFIVFRFLQGVCVCSMMIAGYACIHENYKDNDAVNILALMSGVSISAPMIGPLAGGMLILRYDWRNIFLLIALMSIFSLVFLYFFMPKDKSASLKKLSLKSVLSGYVQLLSNRLFMIHALTFGLLYSGVMLWIAASPFILMVERSLDAENFGLIQIPIFASFAVGSQVTRYLIKKLSLNKTIALGIAMACLGILICFTGTFFFKESLIGLITGMSLYAMGFGVATAPLNRLSFNASTDDKGITASMFYTCMMATGSILTTVFGFIYTGHVLSYVLMIGCIVVFAAILHKCSAKHT